MKPNIEQGKLIQQLLRSALKFNDTYDEVYDHVLSALDALPDDVHFMGTLHNIIEYDFGGAKGLKNIERKHTRLAIRQFIAYYLKAMLVPLTSVAIIFLIAGTGLFYFLIASGWLERIYASLVVTMIPALVFGIAMFKLRKHKKYFHRGLQVYVRQTILGFSGIFMLNFPFFLWHITRMCYKYDRMPPLACAIIFFVVALHTFACHKMCNIKYIAYIV
jgi:hypothetical protein